MIPSHDTSPATVVLSDRLDVKAAGPLMLELVGVRGSDLDIDASAVRRLGAQCLQVLLSARWTWAADGIPFRFVAMSPEFRDALALMGCHELLDAAPVQD